MSYRLGIDVGGTNTDAVILDAEHRVVVKAKRPTTPEIIDGIRAAVGAALIASGLDPTTISHAMLGTTHATNAIVERKNLAKVGIIRLGAPATVAIPPTLDWPGDILACIGGTYRVVRGGYEYDGKPISVPDPLEIEQAARELGEAGVESVAISCVFSPVRGDHELLAKEICERVLGPAVQVCLSSEIGSLGILERENATVLNAAILKVADRAYGGCAGILEELGIEADLLITQNDGTLMTAEYARAYPVLTIASGPTNSLRGAAFLSGLDRAIVVDVGGTTTDVGFLVKGFPRESTHGVEIGGVRTNFRMPDLISAGLGGGSIVRSLDSGITVGPDSVGYRITTESVVFGGATMTATDVAVVAGMAGIGKPGLSIGVDDGVAKEAIRVIACKVEELIDRIKTEQTPVPVVLVGGGSIILGETLEGASQVVRPAHFDVANAIGAAIAQVSGTIDGVFDVASQGREAVVAQVKELATAEAERAGAAAGTIEIVELEEIPLAYMPSNAVRFRVKAVGDLAEAPIRA
ncbi:MAG: hydantoinase/oxoprolinase family protein [Thermoleophilia bacterium]|nr:hydantoinase/oxoprolinase family protein [Thermoleophilia bacterium]